MYFAGKALYHVFHANQLWGVFYLFPRPSDLPQDCLVLNRRGYWVLADLTPAPYGGIPPELRALCLLMGLKQKEVLR